MTSDLSLLMRGIEYAQHISSNTCKIVDNAKAKKNKSETTVALETFAKKMVGLDKFNKSYCYYKWSTYSQADVFNASCAKYGGMQYGVEEDFSNLSSYPDNDISDKKIAKSIEQAYKYAENFAKADINAIEKAYTEYENIPATPRYSLDVFEINSRFDIDMNKHLTLTDALRNLDLDGDKGEFTYEEYAAYLLAVDSYGTFDGCITSEEAKAAEENEDEIKMRAAKFFEYSKKDGNILKDFD